MLLTLINLPFDLITIMVAVFLLQYVKKTGKFFTSIAVANIIFSALMTLVLYSFILMIQENLYIINYINTLTFNKLYEYPEILPEILSQFIIQNIFDLYYTLLFFFKKSVYWFSDILAILWSFIQKKPIHIDIKTFPDVHLIPTLLTTFTPVILYMSVFVFLSFCKFVMLVSARFFEAIGERDESVFKHLPFAHFGSSFSRIESLVLRNKELPMVFLSHCGQLPV